MTGAGAVLALVLIEWATGLVAVAAWNQSWKVVRRGHFKIVAWSALILAILGWLAERSVLSGTGEDAALITTIVLIGGCALYLAAQYVRTEMVSVIVGGLTGVAGACALFKTIPLLQGDWPVALGAASLLTGIALMGAVTNGMLLGHWYLNQPGLQPWALARLTDLALVATGASVVAGVVSVGRLAGAQTEGAVLGLPGFGDSFGPVFFGIWVALAAFTGIVLWMTRRCVKIRSIQSATGLYYVALLTAGVAEFLVRYLMVNAT